MIPKKKIVWRLLEPFFKKEEFGKDADKMGIEILMLIRRIRQELPAPRKIIINCAYEDRPGGHGRGDALDFRIPGWDLLAAESFLQGFFRKYDIENLVAFGIYPEWGNGERPGFHIETEHKIRERPRRWGGIYKRNADNSIFLRDGAPVPEYIAYGSSIEKIKKSTGGELRV